MGPFQIPKRVPRPDYIVIDRKSTRLNSSHLVISYAVFCLKKIEPSLGLHPIRELRTSFITSTLKIASDSRKLLTMPGETTSRIRPTSAFFIRTVGHAVALP